MSEQTVLLEIVIDAPRQHVWKALVEDTAAWWHKDFYTGPAEAFRLEPKLGGWMYEDWGGGNGQLWGTVTGLRAPEMLQVIGDSNSDWGGPNRGIMDWTLEEQGESTLVRFRHALHGHITDRMRESLDGGWRLLLGECLKGYAETGERPAAADPDAS